ncbi:LuxR C-terminal-related transcriptional regulator [Streptomyces sp. NPDC001270]|uniref:LuxR C-terminal-related transcriptional regulator n=1 Tax=Streptomyces sp. NPDC001270 TaxID=3364554 RepID=UPI0036ABA571
MEIATSTGTSELPRSGEVDEFVVRVYERVLAGRRATSSVIAAGLGVSLRQVVEAVRVLRELRLVKDAARSQGELVAVSPEEAQMELLVPLERAIYSERRRLNDVKGQLLSFEDTFNKTQRPQRRPETVVVTSDPAEIELRLMEAVQRCTSEILVMQPCVAQQTPELRHARPLVLEALQRGVRALVLYPHTARGDAGTRSHVRDLTRADGQVRTSREIHGRFIVIDRRVAFVPADDNDDGQRLAVVYDASVAAFLGGIHDRMWESALDYESGASGYSAAMDDLRATILELLASGIKDEVIARRLGMSERSFRRHVAAIMQDLTAGSRFQAGVLAARTGLLGSAAGRPHSARSSA